MFNTNTIYGDKLKNGLKPYSLTNYALLKEELGELEKFIGFIRSTPKKTIKQINEILTQIPSIELEMDMLECKAILSTPCFFNIKKFLFLIKEISNIMQKETWWGKSTVSWNINDDLYELLLIRDTYSFYLGNYCGEEYQKLEEKIQHIEQELSLLAMEEEKEILKSLNLKDKVFFEDCLIISRSETELINEMLNLPKIQLIKETFSTVTFKRKKTSKENFLMQMLSLEEQKFENQENLILERLSHGIQKHLKYLNELTEKLGRFDWLMSKALFAVYFNASVPKLIEDENIIEIKDGIHPIINNELKQKGKKFIPLTINLKTGVAILTGANMGGKTITLKTVGTLLVMAQMGLPVTAKELSFKPLNYLYLSPSVEQYKVGLSSFGAEIQSLKEVLKHKNFWGIILLDELAKGTNPQEGAALARALLDSLSEGNSCVLVTTHLDGLTNIANFTYWQVKGLREINKIIDVNDIYDNFDYGIESVNYNRGVPKDALKVAELLGLDEQILSLAAKYLEGEERDYE